MVFNVCVLQVELVDLKRPYCARSGDTPRADTDPTSPRAVESSAAVDGQAAHTKPTLPPPDGFDVEDDGYLAPLLPASDVRDDEVAIATTAARSGATR
jgi:hypothetical protein